MTLFKKQAEISRPDHYFDLADFEHRDIFDGIEKIWKVLEKIGPYAEKWIEDFKRSEKFWRARFLSGHRQSVFVGIGTKINPPTQIEGPVIIGKNCKIGPFARLRGPIIIGDDCIIGNFTEIKNSILLNGTHAAHHAYVGDSLTGSNVNLGSGTKLANYKFGGSAISVKIKDELLAQKELTIKTGLNKFGAAIGDRTEIGCNSVTAPGTLIGQDVWIGSLINPYGYIPPNSVVKPKETSFEIEQKRIKTTKS